MTAPAEDLGHESWDPLHEDGDQDFFWSTDNIGEAMPGVLSPLGWTWSGPTNDAMVREVAYQMGVFDRTERRRSSVAAQDSQVSIFYGRIALRMDYLATMGDRMPGTTGPEAMRGVFGRVPEDMQFSPTRRRYPFIAARMPWVFTTTPKAVTDLAADTDLWWRRSIEQVGSLDLERARVLAGEARGWFDQAMTTHALGLFAVINPLYSALDSLVRQTGVGDVGSLGGTGGAEIAIVADIWRAATGRDELSTVIANHGFHGPREGEMSSRVWREDDSQLRRLLEDYALRPDPVERERETRARVPGLRRELLAALPARRRPAAALVLHLAARRLPQRGVGKRSFLQALDVARAAARVVGRHLHDAGRLDAPDDVFQLTYAEVTGDLPADLRELVKLRTERATVYRSLEIPASWRGTPLATRRRKLSEMERPVEVTGIGVSNGVVEGPVRLVTDIAQADIEPGEVLVAPTTDPSWASIMYVSSALVVDLGGPLSHAAVVARELGIPCVVNTRTGSRDLRTGDLVRVDGRSGTVQVIRRS